MPIKSYIIHPKKGYKDLLIQEMSAIKQCSVYPAENKDIIVLVTDTQDKEEDKTLTSQIHELNVIDHMAMVTGFDDTNTEHN